MPESDLWDVVVVHLETKKVVSIVGKNLSYKGFHTVDKRVATMSTRVNDDHDVEAVPAGSVKVGDTLILN